MGNQFQLPNGIATQVGLQMLAQVQLDIQAAQRPIGGQGGKFQRLRIHSHRMLSAHRDISTFLGSVDTLQHMPAQLLQGIVCPCQRLLLLLL